MKILAKFARVSFHGGCAWETFESAGFRSSRSANPRTAATHLFRSKKVEPLFTLVENYPMTTNNTPRRFTPMSQLATDYPVLLIDYDAPLRELHNCVSERLNAVLKYLNLMACTSLPDYAEHDINTVTNIARIMVQDVSDVFRVIEQRGFDVPKSQ